MTIRETKTATQLWQPAEMHLLTAKPAAKTSALPVTLVPEWAGSFCSMVVHREELFVGCSKAVFVLRAGKLVALEFVLTPPAPTKDTET
jgi:hypothetical protein